MKIAVTYENGNVFQHFGHTEFFKIYDIENGAVTAATVIATNGHGHGMLAGFLKKHDVDTLICGGIGAGAKSALAEVEIKLYGGVSGDADQAVSDLLAGSLNYNADIVCTHHGEHHHEGGGKEHSCVGTH